MSSREEIEKAKERLAKQVATSNIDCDDYPNCICMKKDLKTLLQYIEELEANNYELNNRLNEFIEDNKKQTKMIDLMASSINSYDSQLNICKYKDKEHVKQHYEEYLEQCLEKKVDEE